MKLLFLAALIGFLNEIDSGAVVFLVELSNCREVTQIGTMNPIHIYC